MEMSKIKIAMGVALGMCLTLPAIAMAAESGGEPSGKHELTKTEFTDRAAQRFDKIDSDHNGTLSRDERRAAHKERHERRVERRERRQSQKSE